MPEQSVMYCARKSAANCPKLYFMVILFFIMNICFLFLLVIIKTKLRSILFNFVSVVFLASPLYVPHFPGVAPACRRNVVCRVDPCPVTLVHLAVPMLSSICPCDRTLSVSCPCDHVCRLDPVRSPLSTYLSLFNQVSL